MNANKYYPQLFQPGYICHVQIKNRIVMLPMGTAYGSATGDVTSKTIDHYETRARGGAGLIIVGNCSPAGRITPNSLQIDADWYTAGHCDLVETVHAWGAKIAIQLNQSGSRMHLGCLEGKQPVSSSAVVRRWLGEDSSPEPRPLSREEIYANMDRWAQGARRAQLAGYDLVELHGAHGYLIGQFMSPFLNLRVDEFGGSFENRMRFPTELIKRVKREVGSNLPVGIRISADEFWPGGMTVRETPAIARILQEAGADFIDVSAGTYETSFNTSDPMRYEQGWKRYLWQAIKKAVTIPVIVGGNIKWPDYAEASLDNSDGDFIGLARGLNADPEWPNKAREGRTKDIRACVSCNECLRTSYKGGGRAARRCAINPSAGREHWLGPIVPVQTRRKVIVIGAGPGGMEAARVAAQRGHDVTLYEKSGLAGGGLILAAAPPGKDKWLWFRDYLKTQAEKAGVKIVLNTLVDTGLIEQKKPDAVIVATGAEPVVPNLPGATGKNVFTAWQVLTGQASVSKQTLVLGGGTVGCETAEYLAKNGVQVTVIEMTSALATDMERTNRHVLLESLNRLGVRFLVGMKVVSIDADGVKTVNPRNEIESFAADSVVLAVGVRPVNELAQALEGKVPELHVIGDCASPRMIIDAVYEGALFGRRV